MGRLARMRPLHAALRSRAETHSTLYAQTADIDARVRSMQSTCCQLSLKLHGSLIETLSMSIDSLDPVTPKKHTACAECRRDLRLAELSSGVDLRTPRANLDRLGKTPPMRLISWPKRNSRHKLCLCVGKRTKGSVVSLLHFCSHSLSVRRATFEGLPNAFGGE